MTKANKAHDTGFIAVDAICAAFEDKEKHTVSIMTMDGFWYEIEGDIDSLYEQVSGPQITFNWSKADYIKEKRMPSPALSEKGGLSLINTLPQRQEPEQYQPRIDRPSLIGKKVRFITPRDGRDISKDLPSGDGKGRYNSKPRWKRRKPKASFSHQDGL